MSDSLWNILLKRYFCKYEKKFWLELPKRFPTLVISMSKATSSRKLWNSLLRLSLEFEHPLVFLFLFSLCYSLGDRRLPFWYCILHSLVTQTMLLGFHIPIIFIQALVLSPHINFLSVRLVLAMMLLICLPHWNTWLLRPEILTETSNVQSRWIHKFWTSVGVNSIDHTLVSGSDTESAVLCEMKYARILKRDFY